LWQNCKLDVGLYFWSDEKVESGGFNKDGSPYLIRAKPQKKEKIDQEGNWYIIENSFFALIKRIDEEMKNMGPLKHCFYVAEIVDKSPFCFFNNDGEPFWSVELNVGSFTEE